MFKNALIYRIESWDPPAPAAIEERLAGQRFIECAASQPESAGWVEPRGQKHGALLEQVAGQTILRLCVERKPVPSSVVKTLLEERLQKIEDNTGRRPRGKQVKELKEAIVHELLPRAFAKRSHTLVWLDAKAGLVWVDAASVKKADALVTRLVDLLGGGLRLALLQTQTSPATAMAEWLATREAPATLRASIVEQHYRPYRAEVERLAGESVARGRRVIHISSHSFTPELNGKVRRADVGLLYHPGRRGEVELCARWNAALAAFAPELRVRRNYPYAGKGDGLTSYLRRHFPPGVYVGIELEVNQKIVQAAGRRWTALRGVLIDSLHVACAA